MGRPSNKTKKEVDSSIEENKKLMEDAKTKNGIDLDDILDIVAPSGDDDMLGGQSTHMPVNTLMIIKEKLGKKVIKKDEHGIDILAPLYDEEEKTKIIFQLLAERGINMLDHLEKILSVVGYNAAVVMSINETMGKVGTMMHEIGDLQYKKEKLKNERMHLEIQKYKADLKKREIDIKEKVADQGPSNNNIIAVGSANQLLEMMNGGDSKIIEAKVIGEDDGA